MIIIGRLIIAEFSFILCDLVGQRIFCAKLRGILANLAPDLINKFSCNNNPSPFVVILDLWQLLQGEHFGTNFSLRQFELLEFACWIFLTALKYTNFEQMAKKD